MTNTMTYKGYAARIEYDDEDGIFTGRIAGIRDVVGFHAETVAECNADEHLGGLGIHGINIREVGHYGFITEMFQWRIGKIKMDAFHQEVGRQNGLPSEMIDDRGIIAHTQEG